MSCNLEQEQEDEVFTPTQDNIHRVCTTSNRTYYLYARKLNGIRVGVGDVVSVAVQDANNIEPSLCYCQVASLWKVINGDSNDFIVAGRWLDPLSKLAEYLSKRKCRYVSSNTSFHDGSSS